MTSTQNVLVCRYRYDPLDRLTSHNLSGKPELQRFYCKSRLATEVQGTIGYSIVQHDDLLLAQQQRRSALVETALLATDLQRSVLQTVKAGKQRHPVAYSPYGHRHGENGLTSLLGFNGERPETVTGHYLLGNGFRAFNPALMRFNSPDNLSPFGKGGLNTYGYCKGDPINYLDRNGNFRLPAFLSKPVALVRKLLKRPDPTTFMNTPAKIFNDPKRTVTFSTTTETYNPDKNYWWRVTEVRDHENIVISTHEIHKENGIISGHHNHKHFAYSATPSLQEQSYSKLSGTELKQLDNLALPSKKHIHHLNSHAEYHTAISRTPEHFSYGRRRGIASEQTRNRIRNGELLGVHPGYADEFDY